MDEYMRLDHTSAEVYTHHCHRLAIPRYAYRHRGYCVRFAESGNEEDQDAERAQAGAPAVFYREESNDERLAEVL